MRTAQFEIVRVALTAVGAIALLIIGFEMAFSGKNAASTTFGWIILLLLGLGVVGACRKRKTRAK